MTRAPDDAPSSGRPSKCERRGPKIPDGALRFVGRHAAARRGVGASRVFRGGFCAYSVRLFISRTPRGPLVVGRRAPDEGRQSPLVRERRAAGRRGEVPVWTIQPAVCEVPGASKRPSSRRCPGSEGNPAARSSAGVTDVVARMLSVIATLSVQERRARRPLAGHNWRAAGRLDSCEY